MSRRVLLTVSGAREELDQVEAALRAQGTHCQRLGLDYAFHSAFMVGSITGQ